MMVTWVRGAFKDIHLTVEFDPATSDDLQVELTISTQCTRISRTILV